MEATKVNASTTGVKTHTALPVLEKTTLGINLQRLRDAFERELIRVLQSIEAEEVTLVLTQRFSTLFAHIFVNGLAALKQNNHVAECLQISDDISNIHCSKVVYLCFAEAEEFRSIVLHAAHVRRSSASNQSERAFHLCASGQLNALCQDVLQHFRMTESIAVHPFRCSWIPLDTDLLTLGYDSCLYDAYVHGNRSALVNTAAALIQFQAIYGRFPKIKYKGELSMAVFHHMMQLDPDQTQSATSTASSKRSPSRLDTLILLDRKVDYASALSLPMTYEALIDEFFHITDGFTSISQKLLSGDANAPDTLVPMALNSSDSVFGSIRSLHVHAIASFLNAKATSIQQQFARFRDSSASATASDVHEFMKQVPELQATQASLVQHTSLLESIVSTTNARAFQDQWQLERAMMDHESTRNVLDDLQDMIFRHEPLLKVVRVLCLYSVVHNGWPHGALDKIKFHLVRTYGHEVLFSLENLKQLGLLTVHSSASEQCPGAFYELVNALDVIDYDVNVENPRNAAFVTSGYAPVSCRLVEEVLKHGNWRQIDKIMKTLPGPRAELSPPSPNKPKPSSKKSTKKPVIMVCFVGGVSYIEIAALRWIATYYPYDIVIAGTSVSSGNAFIQSVLEPIPPVASV